MVWKFSANKRRVFVPSSVSSHNNMNVVRGSYLTKLREWKEKHIPYKSWPSVLSPVAIRDMWFRCGAGVAFFNPNLQKNLKKSPRWNYNGVVYLGEPDPADCSAQGMTYWAFQDIYDSDVPPLRPLWALLLRPAVGVRADVDLNGFAVEYKQGKTWPVHFRKHGAIGVFDPSTNILQLGPTCKVWADYLKTVADLYSHGVTITEKVK